jgi:hypothetical protein
MYIYLGTYYHTRHKGVLSVIQNDEYVTLEKKIGKTIDLDQRETSLNRTKSPIGYIILRAWKTDSDTDRIELAIHEILDNVRSDGEWFEDDDDTLSDRLAGFMERMGYPEITISDDATKLASKISEKKTSDHSEWVESLSQKYPDLFSNKGARSGYLSQNNVADTKINVGLSRNKGNLYVAMWHNGKFDNEQFRNSFTAVCERLTVEPRLQKKQGFVSFNADENDSESKAIELVKSFVNALKNNQIQV